MAKNLFQVHGVDGKGWTVVQRQLRRRQLLPLVAQLRPCLVAMEACGSAHYWAREWSCSGLVDSGGVARVKEVDDAAQLAFGFQPILEVPSRFPASCEIQPGTHAA